jgi:hypothetical protein
MTNYDLRLTTYRDAMNRVSTYDLRLTTFLAD